jgi:dienelactone hydrolase
MIRKGFIINLIIFLSIFSQNTFAKEIKDPIQIKANLKENMKIVKPDGNGPFPTVILFTGAGDPFWRPGYGNWMNWLKERGYASVISDSAKSRGVTGQAMMSRKLMPIDRAMEVFWIKDLLKEMKFADMNNIALMGMSHGGDTVIDALVYASEDPNSYNLNGVKTVVAFYPGCRKPIFGVKLTKNFDNPWRQNNISLSIFQGSIDAWNKIELCQDVVERQKKIGTPITYHFYEKARHCFDEVYHNNISIAKQDEKCRYDEKFSNMAKSEIEKQLKEVFK